MIDFFRTAQAITQPMIDPVIAAHAAHLKALDERGAYQSEILRLMSQITGTREGRNTLTQRDDVDDKLDAFLHALMNSVSEDAVKQAEKELHIALIRASTIEAGIAYRDQLRRDDEEKAMARYQARMERMEELA